MSVDIILVQTALRPDARILALSCTTEDGRLQLLTGSNENEAGLSHNADDISNYRAMAELMVCTFAKSSVSLPGCRQRKFPSLNTP